MEYPDRQSQDQLRFRVLHALRSVAFASIDELTSGSPDDRDDVEVALGWLVAKNAVAESAPVGERPTLGNNQRWHPTRWADRALQQLGGLWASDSDFSIVVEVGEVDSTALGDAAWALGGPENMTILRPALTSISKGIRTPELAVTLVAPDARVAAQRARGVVRRLRSAAGLQQRPTGQTLVI